MTPRERWLALLGGKQPDKLVTDYWATPEVTARLLDQLDCTDIEALYRNLDIDSPRAVGPRHLYGGRRKNDPSVTMWGIRKESINYGTGSYNETTQCPLADVQTVSEMENYDWPSPDDFDYQAVSEFVDNDDGYRILTSGHYEPFLLYCDMRGLERAFEDLLLNPALVECAMEKIFDFFYEGNRRTWTAGNGKIELTYIAEDLGSQHGPLFGLETYRKFLLPNQVKMADLARTHGIRILYHTDGAADVFLPDLVDKVGIDLLNPIQWRCPGMEREKLANDWGDKVIFHSSIDNQHTLPFGSAADVRNEVREAFDLFRNCRWICGPCHNIQPVTPTQNIVAMYEAAAELKP